MVQEAFKRFPGTVLCREVLLSSINVGVLGSLFTWGAVARPKNLGLQTVGKALFSSPFFTCFYYKETIHAWAAAVGPSTKTLGLCPTTPNCISTAEEANDEAHYVPPW